MWGICEEYLIHTPITSKVIYQAYLKQISGSYPSYLGYIKVYLSYILGISQASLMHVSGMSQTCLRHVSGMSQASLRYISGISQVYLRCISWISETYQRLLSAISLNTLSFHPWHPFNTFVGSLQFLYSFSTLSQHFLYTYKSRSLLPHRNVIANLSSSW